MSFPKDIEEEIERKYELGELKICTTWRISLY